MSFAAVILAAGQGTRMKSDQPKVLHEIGGRAMILYVIDAVRSIDPEHVVVVVGYQQDRVRRVCEGRGVEFVVQKEQLGTGHAVLQTQPILGSFQGTVVVLNGDVPGLAPETLARFVAHHVESAAAATVLSARMPDATGYGRIVRDDDGSLLRIVEHNDASARELAIDEINSGLFCFDAPVLFEALRRTDTGNAQSEYYLTDVIDVIRSDGKSVAAYCVEDHNEVAGVNTEAELGAIRVRMEGA
ncbi:MAG: NTP transferase domain-containing protein [Candidatus Krumholzibacteriota bacterium]|nr:NTP transferase domain-containing protein [Candidatus Krumholzibacteriota bacterium]